MPGKYIKQICVIAFCKYKIGWSKSGRLLISMLYINRHIVQPKNVYSFCQCLFKNIKFQNIRWQIFNWCAVNTIYNNTIYDFTANSTFAKMITANLFHCLESIYFFELQGSICFFFCSFWQSVKISLRFVVKSICTVIHKTLSRFRCVLCVLSQRSHWNPMRSFSLCATQWEELRPLQLTVASCVNPLYLKHPGRCAEASWS